MNKTAIDELHDDMISDVFTDEDAVRDIEADSVRNSFGESTETRIPGRDYPEYVVDELYEQDHFDLDGNKR